MGKRVIKVKLHLQAPCLMMMWECLNVDCIRSELKTNIAEIRRMDDNITLILHHGGGLEQDEYQRLQYVRGEFCVWEKMVVDELCLWDIANATSTI